MKLATITDHMTGTTYPGSEEIQELIITGNQNDFCRDMVARSLARVRNLAYENGMDRYVALYEIAMGAIGAEG